MGVEGDSGEKKVLSQAKYSDQCQASSIWVSFSQNEERDEEMAATAVWELNTTSYGEFTVDLRKKKKRICRFLIISAEEKALSRQCVCWPCQRGALATLVLYCGEGCERSGMQVPLPQGP